MGVSLCAYVTPHKVTNPKGSKDKEQTYHNCDSFRNTTFLIPYINCRKSLFSVSLFMNGIFSRTKEYLG